MNNNKILIAKIISAHGIKGEVKIISFCQNVKDIENYHCFDQNQEKISIKILNSKAKSTKNGDYVIIAKIENINTRNDAEKIIGTEIFTLRENFKNLDEDEFYHTDLINLDVISDGKKVGKITNIYNFGAGEMLEIEFEQEDKTRNLSKTESFSFENKYFGKIDIKNGFIEFFMPEIINEK